jgi:hypothetical protein
LQEKCTAVHDPKKLFSRLMRYLNSFRHRMIWKLVGKVTDIETAFLHGYLKETIYTEMPKGIKAKMAACLILKGTTQNCFVTEGLWFQGQPC